MVMERKRVRKKDVTNDGEIRLLVNKLNPIRDKNTILKTQRDSLNITIERNLATIKELEEQIHELRNPNIPKVSEHAIVRYFERVLGFDIETIQDEILTPEILTMMETLGKNGTYPLGEEFRIKVKDNTVVTILPKKYEENV